MQLTPLAERFVLHFGEMGSRWGVNRTVGQIYALLYIAGRPLNADDIGETLAFSRSNVGIGIKELQAWRLVRLVHQPGDRRDYFEPPKDVWEIFRVLMEERRRREIEPTLSMLREALMEAPSTEEDRVAQDKMRQMYELIELTTGWFDDVQRLSPETVIRLMQLGAKVQKVLEFADRLKLTGGRETERE
ncbi:MAG: GbsR/MarR family transcriptional regulator [Burkholderiales bacterium]|nr:GbsR/MarR family transcriptional regulator [Burkholderiales bacterium]